MKALWTLPTKKLLNHGRGQEFKVKVGRSWAHSQNFIDGIKDKAELFAPVETGHRSCCACLGEHDVHEAATQAEWDPEKELFVNDDEANRLMDAADARRVETLIRDAGMQENRFGSVECGK